MTKAPENRPAAGAAPILLSGLAPVARRYEGFIIDLWGTLHDGVRAYPAAIEALLRLRARSAPVCLLSNAARPVAEIAAKLAGMGIDRNCYDHLVSSGQATIAALRHLRDAPAGSSYYLIGPEDGPSLLEGLDYVRVDAPRAAAFILNAGSRPGTDLSHYEGVLADGARHRLPMICANPDLFVDVGGRRIMCAGTIARRYEALGGSVRYFGKPDPAIYRACLARLRRPAAAVLAIGDGLETDIAGANNAGMASVLVLGGLHADQLDQAGAAPPRDKVMALFTGGQPMPTYVMPYLRW